jgi:ribosomal protein S1
MKKGQMICGKVISINEKGCFVDVDCDTENYIAIFYGHARIGDRVLLGITKVLDNGVLRCELQGNLNPDLLCA